MGIVTGATRLAYDYSKEAHEEEKRWAREKREADKAREIESERKTWWGIGSTLICLGLGGGPICPVVGATVGNIAKGVGTWKGKSIESFDLSEDVGKFEKGQIEDVRNYNRALDAGDKAEFWQGIQDIGTSLLFSWKYGTVGGDATIAENIESWSPTKWGGKEGIEFGGKEAWQMFFDRPDIPAVNLMQFPEAQGPPPPPRETSATEDFWKILYGQSN